MPSTQQAIHHCLLSDSVTREALIRGVVNYRGLAKWLSRTYKLEASEASIANALRRMQAAAVEDCFAPARDILRRSYVNSRARRTSFVVPNTALIQERLPALLKAIDYARGDTIRVISFDGGFKIILDEANFPKATSTFGSSHIHDVKHGLVELSVVMPQSARDTPGVYALIANALAVRRINIEEGWVSVRQEVVFVREEDLIEAYDALSVLVQAGGAAGLRQGQPPGVVP